MKETFIACLFFAFGHYVQCQAIEPTGFNDVERMEDGWFKVSAGDPYITFQTGSIPISEIHYLKVTLTGKNVPNRHSYVELFWANSIHGYSEALKGFFINPFPITSGEGIPVVLNLREFLEAIGENGSHIDLIRLDLDRDLGGDDFRFKCEIEFLESSDVDGAEFQRLHGPFLSRHLFNAGLFKYTVGNIFLDFFQRFFRDFVFLIVYISALGGIMFSLVLIRRKIKQIPLDE